MYVAARKDPNPAALFIILFMAVPNASISLSGLPFEIFPLNHRRILEISFLGPILFIHTTKRGSGQKVHFDLMFYLLLAFATLTLILDSEYNSPTHNLRLLIVAFLDTFFIYYIFSNLRSKPEIIQDCMSMWVLVAVLLSAVAIFEASKGWLLYSGVNYRWGDENKFAFLMRANSLRAQASAGHSLTLGIWLSVAWAFFLLLQRGREEKLLRNSIALLLLGGLWACAARGAWLATIGSTLAYLLLNPAGFAKGVRNVIIFLLIIIGILASPLGQAITNYLPFVGNIDSGNIDYRVRLFEVCLELIKNKPFFGDHFAANQMESLRQGQGIIDFVNGYLQVAVFYGLITLVLFLALLVVGINRSVTVWRKVRFTDPKFAWVGASLVASMIGSMLFIATAGIDPMTYMLAGMMSSYWWMSRNPEPF